jgi:predicted ATPase
VALNPINVIIGANGSGKSNFVGAFAFLREIGAGRLKNYVRAAGGAEKVLHFGSKTTEKIDLEVYFNIGGFGTQPSPSAYYLTLAPTADDGLFPSREEIRRSAYPAKSLSEWQLGLEAGISNPASEIFTKGKRQQFDFWQLFHLHDTSYMRKTASVGDNRFLRANGSNLAAFLYYLRMRWVDSYNLIVQSIRQVAPFFDDFDWPREEDRRDDIQLVWRHKGSDQYFNASSLSDGTLRFIALATLFLQPRSMYSNSIFLVDEPELGLHPYAIEILAALIRQASAATQVIVSTQSSLLIDHFEPEDVLVADRVDGGTQLTRLDSGRLKKWLEDYSLGQLWEKNEFGGRPVPG